MLATRVFLLLFFFGGLVFADCQFGYEAEEPFVNTKQMQVIDYTNMTIATRTVTKWSSSQVAYSGGANVVMAALGCKTDKIGQQYCEQIPGDIPDNIYHAVVLLDLHANTQLVIRCKQSGGKIRKMFNTPECSYTTTEEIKTCPSGYVLKNNSCQKTVGYSFKEYYCDINNKNPQGFGWEFDPSTLSPVNTGTKIDPDIHNKNASLLDDVYNYNKKPQCRRKYQACTMDCPDGQTFDKVKGVCYISFEDECKQKGMVYDATYQRCVVENNCNDSSAIQHANSQKCEIKPSCSVSDSGVCSSLATFNCFQNTFLYSEDEDKCLSQILCSEAEYVNGDTKCASKGYCNSGDVDLGKTCSSTIPASGSCTQYERDGNVCFDSSTVGSEPIVQKKPLVVPEVSGGYKAQDNKEVYPIFCSDSNETCKFKITDIYSSNNGKSLCFRSASGEDGCVNISGDCSVSGSIHYDDGIRQLRVRDFKKIDAFDISASSSPLGTIDSTCALVGKAGSFDEPYASQGQIGSVSVSSGNNLIFFDKYKRGFIGNIAFIPTIKQEDIDNGFAYSDKDIMDLLNKGFTSFYADSGSVYAVYNGYISKSNCVSMIDGTSFYFSYPSTEAERSIYQGLSFYRDNYNYLNGDETAGSCVVKSDTAESILDARFAKLVTEVPKGQTAYMCSPFICKDHTCQSNRCQTGMNGSEIEESLFSTNVINANDKTTKDRVCISNVCDSNLPYVNVCGNKKGCDTSKEGVFMQQDGSCVQASCDTNNGEYYDGSLKKCVKLGCKDSILRDGKCYRSVF